MELLQNRRAELTRRIERERAQLAEVDAWLAQIERAGRVPDYEVTIKQLAPRLVASVVTRPSYADADELFDELHSNFNTAARLSSAARSGTPARAGGGA